MSDEHLPNTVRTQYRRPDGLRSAFASGVYGSLTPSGHFNLIFYYETVALPEPSLARLEDGYLVSETEETENNQIADVTREVNASVVLDLESVMNLHETLTGFMDEYSDLFSRISAGKVDSDE